MRDFVLFTDSGSDIKPEILAEWGVSSLPLHYRFEGEEGEYADGETDVLAFYDRMRAGAVARTSAINPDAFIEAFTPILESGRDILYLGFSSGLSTTFNSARIAAESLKETFPDASVTVVDTLAASAGQGLLVHLAAEKKKAGATLAEVADFVRDTRLNLCHWFTVDDLTYLKRGGRVSAAAAFVGGLIGIKPVLHVDDEGHLIPMAKVRGRKTALTALLDKYGETALDKENGLVYISNADCEGDVNYLKEQLKARFGAEVHLVTDIGAVIGAHAGPGTIALFYLGTTR